MLQGCRVDLTVALVDGDSSLCGLPTVSTEDLVRARDEACGLLVGHPMPGVDPCTTTVEGSPEIRGSCDPTIAYGGCPDEPDVVVMDDDTICFPAPPSAPPMPCVDPTPGGGPIVGETKTWSPSPSGFLQDSFGGVFVVSRGGIIVIGQGTHPTREVTKAGARRVARWAHGIPMVADGRTREREVPRRHRATVCRVLTAVSLSA